jgi:hypothetical protein
LLEPLYPCIHMAKLRAGMVGREMTGLPFVVCDPCQHSLLSTLCTKATLPCQPHSQTCSQPPHMHPYVKAGYFTESTCSASPTPLAVIAVSLPDMILIRCMSMDAGTGTVSMSNTACQRQPCIQPPLPLPTQNSDLAFTHIFYEVLQRFVSNCSACIKQPTSTHNVLQLALLVVGHLLGVLRGSKS